MSEQSFVKTLGDVIWVIGTAIAATISWDTYHSILWAVIHAGFGWAYLVYFWWGRG